MAVLSDDSHLQRGSTLSVQHQQQFWDAVELSVERLQDPDQFGAGIFTAKEIVEKFRGAVQGELVFHFEPVALAMDLLGVDHNTISLDSVRKIQQEYYSKSA